MAEPQPGEPDIVDYATVRLKRIILAAAHLDHDPTNSSEENLKALYQRCHLAHDRPHNRRRFAVTILARRALGDLFSGPYLAWKPRMASRRQRRSSPSTKNHGAQTNSNSSEADEVHLVSFDLTIGVVLKLAKPRERTREALPVSYHRARSSPSPAVPWGNPTLISSCWKYPSGECEGAAMSLSPFIGCERSERRINGWGCGWPKGPGAHDDLRAVP